MNDTVEPPYPLIHQALVDGDAVPFLGAGASLSRPPGAVEGARLPSAGELAHALADTTRFPSSDEHDRGDLAKVASYFAETNGRRLLRGHLRSRLAVDVAPGALHRYLAGLPGERLIVTTNYDTLLEQALDGAGRAYHLVVHPIEREDWRGSVLWWPPGATEPRTPAANELDLDPRRETVVYKMHGSIGRSGAEWDNYVITEDDYADFLSQMAGGSGGAIPAIFQAWFRPRNFLFLGYGLSDWNLRVILNNLSRHLKTSGRASDQVSWAIQKNPSLFERKLWSKRDVEIYDLDLDAFVAELQG